MDSITSITIYIIHVYSHFIHIIYTYVYIYIFTSGLPGSLCEKIKNENNLRPSIMALFDLFFF